MLIKLRSMVMILPHKKPTISINGNIILLKKTQSLPFIDKMIDGDNHPTQ